MIPLSSVNWGPSDALKQDRNFSKKWIEPPHIKSCLAPNKWIISGEKGSGKSAIRKAIHDIYGGDYLATPIVDFDDVTFGSLYSNLLELAKTAQLSETTTLSKFWQYSILVEMMVACAKADRDAYGPIKAKLPQASTRIRLHERLLRLLEDAWNMIDDYTREDNNGNVKVNLISSSGYTAEIVSILSKYPIIGTFNDIVDEFFSYLDERGDRVVLILDGFDRMHNEGASAKAVALIFESLVDAIRSLQSYNKLPYGFEIKAFIPHDKYISLPLRDSDKVDTMHTAIKWTYASLQEFLRKRIELTDRVQSDQFSQLWKQVMPETIVNSYYRLEEDSFDYVLRHTMMRPRQLQIHLEHLSNQFHNSIIDPSGVPKSISESSMSIARHFLNEYKLEYPKLDVFLSSLRGKPNIMEYREFRQIVSVAKDRNLLNHASFSIDSEIDSLYSIGIFGIVNFLDPGQIAGDVRCPPTRDSKRHYVEFFYQTYRLIISSMLCDDSLIAFHPIFVDFVNLRPHPQWIVG